DRLGGGGHLTSAAVVGGQLGVRDDLRVGGQGLLAGIVEQRGVLGRVGGVHLILDDDHVRRRGSRPGNVTADVPVVQVLAGKFRAGGAGAGHVAEVAGGSLDDLVPVDVRELAELGQVFAGVELLGDRGLRPFL